MMQKGKQFKEILIQLFFPKLSNETVLSRNHLCINRPDFFMDSCFSNPYFLLIYF